MVSSDWKPPREEENEVWDKDRIKMRILDPADIDGPALEAIPKTPYTKWFDYDIIENSVTYQDPPPRRLSGDRQGRSHAEAEPVFYQ